MRQTIIFIVLFFYLCSCNNESSPVAKTETISEEKQLMESIKKYPDSLLLMENLVKYYTKNNNCDNAIAVINDAIQKDSTIDKLWDIKAMLHFENDDTLNAIKAYEKALAIYPAPEYIMSLGSLYAATKNPMALEMADALIVANKANANKEALFIKGLYYNYINDKQKAIEFFDSCLALDYTFMFAYREKAIALYDMRKYNDALKVLDKAVTLQNDFDEGYYWRGRCLEKQKKINEAIEEYKTALLYDPNFIEAQDALAKLGVK
jgi:tetratricopeptide (TPR) repeat protein